VIRRRAFVAGIAAIAVAARRSTAVAQQVAKVHRIGYLSVARPATSPFMERLKELGYSEGRNIEMECRSWGGRPELLDQLAASLVEAKVDVIVALSPNDIAAAMKATRTIPIVMVYPGDPVAMGFVHSLGRPGGNVTGLSWAPDVTVTEKAVEILKIAVPSARTIGVLWNTRNRSHPLYVKIVRRAIEKMGAAYVSVEISKAEDLEDAFRHAKRQQTDALVIFPDPLTVPNHRRITNLALAERLPTMVTSKFRFDDALFAFGAKVSENPRKAADYVDRILKGAEPSTLPVEQPAAIEFVINLKTARALGLTIPPSLLLRSDQVIE
jgi:putative tryptophan/tyrosine transport system substrate-binding protein